MKANNSLLAVVAVKCSSVKGTLAWTHIIM